MNNTVDLGDRITLGKALVDAGIVPELCTSFTLHINLDEPMSMSLEVMLTQAQAEALADVFKANADILKRISCQTEYIKRRDDDAIYYDAPEVKQG